MGSDGTTNALNECYRKHQMPIIMVFAFHGGKRSYKHSGRNNSVCLSKKEHCRRGGSHSETKH